MICIAPCPPQFALHEDAYDTLGAERFEQAASYFQVTINNRILVFDPQTQEPVKEVPGVYNLREPETYVETGLSI